MARHCRPARAGLLLTADSLGDRFGRKRALTGGLVVFGLGSALAALAQDPAGLIASRALMGIGAAFIMPSTLSILTHVFPREERAKATAIWAALAGLGIAIGPVAGGWLLEHGDWHLVFVVNMRGEVRADIDIEVTVDVLAAPMIYRILISAADPAALKGLPEGVFELVSRGLRTP